MEVNVRSARIKTEQGTSRLTSSYQTNDRYEKSCLSFYRTPPTREVKLSDFEQSASDRLQLLQYLEAQTAKRTSNQLKDDDWTKTVKDALIRFKLFNDPERDNLSHHVLRLAYCLTDENRRWFLNAECHLFRARFELESPDVIAHLLGDRDRGPDCHYEVMSRSDFERLRHQLQDVAPSQIEFASMTSREFYCVPFEDAIDLIAKRRVLLEGGWAFVNKSNLVTIIQNRFRLHLSKQLAASSRMRRAAAVSERDPRIAPVLSSLSKHAVGASYSSTSMQGAVKLSELPSLLTSPSTPLCMSAMYNELTRSHHLKYNGRTSFNLFLKGIGLTMNDALTFWKTSMSRRTPGDKFDKEYAYNVRHGYGKEGKRADYTPYSCIKIINTLSQSVVQGPGECQGCPFKTSDDKQLKQMLLQRGVTMSGVDEVLKLAHDSHYQVACQRVFSFTHGNQVPDGVGNHPNAYFDASLRLTRCVATSGDATTKSESDETMNGSSSSLTQNEPELVTAAVAVDD